MDRSNQRKTQHVYLQTAATTVHINTAGAPPDPRDIAKMTQTLDNVAHAMALVIPIYTQSPDGGLPIEIPAAELLSGKFSRGARVFKALSGKTYNGLSVQRADMEAAIAILKRTHERKA